RPLPRSEEPMARERGEGRVLRRRAEEDARDEVENAVAGGGRHEEAGQEDPGRLGLPADLRGEDREDSDPGALGREEEGRDVVYMQPGRKAGEHAGRQAQEGEDDQSE